MRRCTEKTGCTGRCTTVKGAGIRDEETKRMFYRVSAVVHLFLKIAGAMPVVFLLFLVVNVLHGTAWALETLARQVFFDGLQSAVERNSLQAAYSGALWVGAAAVYVQVLNGAGNFIGQHIFNPRQ